MTKVEMSAAAVRRRLKLQSRLRRAFAWSDRRRVTRTDWSGAREANKSAQRQETMKAVCLGQKEINKITKSKIRNPRPTKPQITTPPTWRASNSQTTRIQKSGAEMIIENKAKTNFQTKTMVLLLFIIFVLFTAAVLLFLRAGENEKLGLGLTGLATILTFIVMLNDNRNTRLSLSASQTHEDIARDGNKIALLNFENAYRARMLDHFAIAITNFNSGKRLAALQLMEQLAETEEGRRAAVDFLFRALRSATRQGSAATHQLDRWAEIEISTILEVLGRYYRLAHGHGARLSRSFLSGLEVRGGDFREFDLTKAAIRNGVFWSSNFSGANFQESLLVGTQFYGGWLVGAKFDSCTISNCCAEEGIDCSKISFIGSSIKKTTLAATLQEAIFYGSQTILENVNFSGSNLKGADFRKAKLLNINFSTSDLRGARFNESEIENAVFLGATLDEDFRTQFSNVRNFDWSTLVGAKSVGKSNEVVTLAVIGRSFLDQAVGSLLRADVYSNSEDGAGSFIGPRGLGSRNDELDLDFRVFGRDRTEEVAEEVGLLDRWALALFGEKFSKIFGPI